MERAKLKVIFGRILTNCSFRYSDTQQMKLLMSIYWTSKITFPLEFLRIFPENGTEKDSKTIFARFV